MTELISPVLELAKALIACSSLTPHDAGCQTIITDKLTALGFHCEHLRFGEVDNLWARYGQASPLLVFAGHTDVVPSGPESNWSSPPFSPTLREGYLYGRGATDMKGALAAMVIAAQQFIAAHPNFSGSLAFLITSDEEGPAIHGTKKVIEVLQNRGEKIDYCIVGEASSESVTGDQVRVGRRGSLHGKLRIQGKQGHVAYPELVDNPIHRSLLALHELAHEEWDKGNEFFPPTSFQITNIHSGTGAENVVPGQLETLFNFRFATASTIEDLQARSEAILKRHALNYAIEWKVGAEPFLTQAGKLLTVVQQAIQATANLEVKFSTAGGTSDGRFIAPTGAEVVELGVPYQTAHQIDEKVKVSDLEMLVKIYLQVLQGIF